MRFTLLALAVLVSVALSSCSLLGPQGCKTDEIPDTPTMLSVTQDPDTLKVTAIVIDNSRNEQWFTLERARVSQFNRATVVGTSVDVVDREKLSLNRDTDREVTIVDRGLFEGEMLESGKRYSYTARAWNCYGWSEEPEDIIITAN